MAKAAKKLSPGFLNRVFRSDTDRRLTACSLYSQAAALFRQGKECIGNADQLSCQAFLKCAECVPSDAAQYLTEAGDSVSYVSSADAIMYYTQASSVHAESGRISMIAKLKKKIAELYEQDNALEQSIECYQEAGELFENNNSESTANICFLKVAELSVSRSIDPASCAKAIRVRLMQLFDHVSLRYLRNNATKQYAKELFFKACILHVVLAVWVRQDSDGAAEALNKYIRVDQSFESYQGCKLVKDLLAALREQRASAFDMIVCGYTQFTSSIIWIPPVLMKIKSHLETSFSKESA